MTDLIIVDYGIGNLGSVVRGFQKVGSKATLSSNPDEIAAAGRLVLPGVGAFKVGMKNLRKSGVLEGIRAFIGTGNPLLGICLGMQILFENSDENGLCDGMGIVPGKVRKIPVSDTSSNGRKIPHIGWNTLKPAVKSEVWDASCLRGLDALAAVYFVHSYFVTPTLEEHLFGTCDYDGHVFAAAIRKENILGLQFHPEKSASAGLRCLENFVKG